MKRSILIIGLALLATNVFCVFPELSTYAYYNYNNGDVKYSDPTDPAAKEYIILLQGDFFLATDAHASASGYTSALSKIRIFDTSLGWYLTQENNGVDAIPEVYGQWYYDIEVDKAELTVRASVTPYMGPQVQSASANAKLMW